MVGLNETCYQLANFTYPAQCINNASGGLFGVMFLLVIFCIGYFTLRGYGFSNARSLATSMFAVWVFSVIAMGLGFVSVPYTIITGLLFGILLFSLQRETTS